MTGMSWVQKMVKLAGEMTPEEIVYPYYGQANDGCVVLFTSYGIGTVTQRGPNNPAGEFHDEWNVNDFRFLCYPPVVP